MPSAVMFWMVMDSVNYTSAVWEVLHIASLILINFFKVGFFISLILWKKAKTITISTNFSVFLFDKPLNWKIFCFSSRLEQIHAVPPQRKQSSRSSPPRRPSLAPCKWEQAEGGADKWEQWGDLQETTPVVTEGCRSWCKLPGSGGWLPQAADAGEATFPAGCRMWSAGAFFEGKDWQACP